MKRLFSAAFLLLMSGTLFSQVFVFEKKYKNHLEAARLKGNVKSVKEYVYKGATYRKDSIPDPIVDYYFLVDYNKHGNMIEKKQMRADHSLARLEKYFYNDKQQLVRQVGRYEDPSTEEVNLFSYDKGGNRIKEVVTMFKGTLTIVTRDFSFDAKKRATEMVITYPTQNQVDRRTYRYDAKDNMIELLIFGKKTTVRYTYKYPDPGRVVSYFRSYPNNTKPTGEPKVTVTKYDKDENLIYTVYDKGEDANPDFIYYYEHDKERNWTRKFAQVLGETQANNLAGSRQIEYW